MYREETGSEESSKGRTIPKFQTDLVPFSEEWLAALEAYGEVSILIFFYVSFATPDTIVCIYKLDPALYCICTSE